MKDYYDIYYLANKFDFDGCTLCEALQKTFVNREHSFTSVQFYQMIGFGENEIMQKKWKAFCRKIDVKCDDYSTVLDTINVFLCKPFTAAIENEVFTGRWFAAENKWNQEK